jgi:hypothetical protein
MTSASSGCALSVRSVTRTSGRSAPPWRGLLRDGFGVRVTMTAAISRARTATTAVVRRQVAQPRLRDYAPLWNEALVPHSWSRVRKLHGRDQRRNYLPFTRDALLERHTQDPARAAALATARLVEGRGPSVAG